MPLIRVVTSNFLTGEINPTLIGRTDTEKYFTSLKKGKNVFLDPTGGVYRRPGWEFLENLGEIGRTIQFTFEFNIEQTYTFVVYDEKVKIFKDEEEVAEEDLPYKENELFDVRWTQSADTLIIFHPKHPTKKVVRGGNHNTWTISDLSWKEVPLFNFNPSVFSYTAGTIKTTAVSGTVRATSSTNVFNSSDYGGYLTGNGGEGRITRYIDQKNVEILVLTPFIDDGGEDGTSGWKIERGYEPAWSATRGYPRSGTFHQNVLVVGGSRDLPDVVWKSKIGDFFNFPPGIGLATDAQEIPLVADQLNEIRDVVSAGHLEIFTTGGEFFIQNDNTGLSNKVIKPVRSDTRGISRVRPLYVDGTTLFVQNRANIVRELIFDELNQKYNTVDVSLLSNHLIKSPVNIAHYKPSSETRADLIFVVNSDGSTAVFNTIRMQQINGWTHCFSSREGVEYLSMSYDNNYMYATIKQPNGDVYFERLNFNRFLDESVVLEELTPTSNWSGLEHLEGLEVTVFGNESYLDGNHIVENGEITTNNEYERVEVGVNFVPEMELQTPEAVVEGGSLVGKTKRIGLVTVSMHETLGITINDKPIFFRQFGDNIFDEPLQPFTGSKEVILLGWEKNPTVTIKQVEPGPFHILSVAQEVHV